MPDARFAQKLLALVTPPERAESAVGDLLEQSESRGEFWFWRSVLQLTVAHAMTAESRKHWTMLPALLDITVFVTLIFFLIGSLRGIAITFVVSLGWSYALSVVFPSGRNRKHIKLCLAWSFVWTTGLWLVFR